MSKAQITALGLGIALLISIVYSALTIYYYKSQPGLPAQVEDYLTLISAQELSEEESTRIWEMLTLDGKNALDEVFTIGHNRGYSEGLEDGLKDVNKPIKQ